MDANRTHFYMLLGERDWADCLIGDTRLSDRWHTNAADPAGLAWDAGRAELTLRPNAPIFAAATGAALGLARRRGAGCDAFGNWYWIDAAETTIAVQSSGTGAASTFWRIGDDVRYELPASSDFHPVAPPPLAPRRLCGLAVTTEHYLVVGTLDPAGLLLFDLHAGGPPRQLVWPVPFAPFDIAPAPDGGAWLLERRDDSAGQPARYWALDRHMQVIPQGAADATLEAAREPDFQPAPLPDEPAGDVPKNPPVAARTFPQGIALDAAVALPLIDPVAIEGLPDGTVLLLDNGGDGQANQPFAQIWRFGAGKPLGRPASTRVIVNYVDAPADKPFSLLGHDLAFVPGAADDGTLGQLLIVGAQGQQSFGFRLRAGAAGVELLPQPTTYRCDCSAVARW